MLKRGTRVVMLASDDGKHVGQLGTVVENSAFRDVALVEWDDGDMRIESTRKIESQQKLKAMFKHGPKLKKGAKK